MAASSVETTGGTDTTPTTTRMAGGMGMTWGLVAGGGTTIVPGATAAGVTASTTTRATIAQTTVGHRS